MTNNLQEIAKRDSLQELCQQDKELMWSFRSVLGVLHIIYGCSDNMEQVHRLLIQYR